MNTQNGWIKLHRAILENPICKKPVWAWLWVVLLLKANHAKNNMIWNGGVVQIKEGQFVTGRKELSKETGIPESTIEDILKYLETRHQIRQQKTSKYRLITIVNWETFQKPDSKSDNRATTKQQQSDTNNNDKKEKKYTAKAATRNTQGQSSVKQLLEKYKYTSNT